jgi:hypothetical protein
MPSFTSSALALADDLRSIKPAHPRRSASLPRLEKAGIEFIPENGGGARVRLAKRARKSK